MLLHPPLPGLLIAVSASVDKIISHFGAARNLVQKVKVSVGGCGVTSRGQNSWQGGDWRHLWTQAPCTASRPSWGIAG